MNEMVAVISGDIISSTSFTDESRTYLEESLSKLLLNLKNEFNVFGRVIKGDYLECVIPEPENALTVAIAIKCFIKSISLESNEDEHAQNRFKFFKTYGLRLAIGYGKLTRYDEEKGIIDGEAIYFSGRTISEESGSYKKERIVIKNTLFFASAHEELNQEFEPLLYLLDVLLAKATAKQCEVVYLKLMNNNEDAISKIMKIAQSVVNQHSTSVGWNAIDKAVTRFNKVIKSIK